MPSRKLDLAPAVGAAAGVAPTNGEMSDSASKLASKIPTNRTDEPAPEQGYGLSDMLADRVDPELDLVALGVRVPRYVAQALDVQVRLRSGRKQDIVTNALKESIDPVILGAAYRKAQGQ